MEILLKRVFAGYTIGTIVIVGALLLMGFFKESESTSNTPLISDTIKTELEQYKFSNGSYPDTLDKINIKEDDVYYNYIGPDRYTLGITTGFLTTRYHSESKITSEIGSPQDIIDSANDLQYQKLLLNSVNAK